MLNIKKINLPIQCGIYKFLDKEKNIIYIGKAKNIQKRVKQHFNITKNISAKNKKMIDNIHKVDFIITDTETESLILEAILIKKHLPKYNILLKDDKNYVYIQITNEDFPQIKLVRNTEDKKSKYLGPFTNTMALKKSLKLAEKFFPYKCLTFWKKGITNTPCFNYHIKKCPGLCIGEITKEDYKNIIYKIINFLNGDIDEIINNMELDMKIFAKEQNFEKAMKIRDDIQSIQKIYSTQKILDPNKKDEMDIIGIYVYKNNIFVCILQIKEGKLISTKNFEFEKRLSENLSEIIKYIILNYYYNLSIQTPKKILIETDFEDRENIINLLEEKSNIKSNIKIAKTKEEKNILELANKNAEEYAKQKDAKISMKLPENKKEIIKKLKSKLKLKKLNRIECYDISHIGGDFTVGSMIVFEKNNFLKKDYRLFKLDIKNDDYLALQNVFQRRKKYFQKDKKDTSLNKKPDIILIDGSKGQLNIGLEILQNDLKQTKFLAIAKENEEIFDVNGKLDIKNNSDISFLLQTIRDEAHRFAISNSRKNKRKSVIKSLLDEIPGLGPKRKMKLKSKYKTIEELKKADLKELSDIVGTITAKRIKEVI